MAPETDTSPLAWLGSADDARRDAGLRRSLTPRSAVGCDVDLASNDYLGLARHPVVIDAGVRALRWLLLSVFLGFTRWCFAGGLPRFALWATVVGWACKAGKHFSCRDPWCKCHCHGWRPT
jgi:hypothetical protein